MSSELETNIVSVERTKEYSVTPTEVRLTVAGAIWSDMPLVSTSDGQSRTTIGLRLCATSEPDPLPTC